MTRWVGLVIAGLAAVASLLLAPTVLALALAPYPADPHGYGQIFGSLMLVVATLVGVTALTLTSLVLQGRAVRWAAWLAVVWMLVGLGTVAGVVLYDRPPPSL